MPRKPAVSLSFTCSHCRKTFQRKQYSCKKTTTPFCSMTCYGMWQRGKTQSQQGKKTAAKKYCKELSCNSIHFGRGYCRKHYLSNHYRPLLTNGHTPKKTKPLAQYICLHCNNTFQSEMRSYNRTPKFCSLRCSGRNRRKRYIVKNGYKKILQPNHHRSDNYGYVFEHILVMERHLGRNISSPEVIHHIDHNKLNNDPSNLMIFKNNKDHIAYHATCARRERSKNDHRQA